MSKKLFKGPGLGTSEWREDFVLTDTDGVTALFKVATDGTITCTNNQIVANPGNFKATGTGEIDGNFSIGDAYGGSPTFKVTASSGAFTANGLATLASGLDLTQIDAALTAKTGGGQDSAATSSKLVCVVTTVTSGNDSFTLPAATGSGAVHIVSNQAAANSMQLFGLGSDTVNAAASGTGVAVTTKKSAFCVDYASGKWLAIIA